MRDSIVKLSLEYLDMGRMRDDLNDASITFTPKVTNPDRVNQFRPISLCNVSYKIIANAITNSVKLVLHDLISEEQSSLVLKRQITDNILVYQEVLHNMRKKQGSKGIMVLKIDLEKVYDRLSWDVIHEALKDAGFN